LLRCASMDEAVGLNMEANADSDGSENQNVVLSQPRLHFPSVSLGVFSVAAMMAVVAHFRSSSPGKPSDFQVDGVIVEASTDACHFGNMAVPQDFGYLIGGWAPCKNDKDLKSQCAFTMVAEDDDGKYLAGLLDGRHFKMAKFNADGSRVKGTGKYYSGQGEPADGSDMVKKYKTAKGTGDNYRFHKGNGFTCPEEEKEEDTAGEGKLTTQYGRWTSPYYYHTGLCPKGEAIILKEDCHQAGGLFGLGGEIKIVEGINSGCTKSPWKGVEFNPNREMTKLNEGIISICKKLPKDMHDFAALQADHEKMIFHCLTEVTDSFTGFRNCMLQVKQWNLEGAWTEADRQAQLEAVQQAEDKEAKEKEEAENACWKKTDGKIHGDPPPRSWDHPEVAIKAACVKEGKEKCTAISCYEGKNFYTNEPYNRCDTKGPNEQMKTPPHKQGRKYYTLTRC